MNENDRPLVGRAYRVIEQYPAIQIELSYEELDVLLMAARVAAGPVAYSDLLRSATQRLHVAMTAMRAARMDYKGERKVYDA